MISRKEIMTSRKERKILIVFREWSGKFSRIFQSRMLSFFEVRPSVIADKRLVSFHVVWPDFQDLEFAAYFLSVTCSLLLILFLTWLNTVFLFSSSSCVHVRTQTQTHRHTCTHTSKKINILVFIRLLSSERTTRHTLFRTSIINFNAWSSEMASLDTIHIPCTSSALLGEAVRCSVALERWCFC